MIYLKKFNESKDLIVSDILGNLSTKNITNKGIGFIIDENYSYNEIKDFYIDELKSYESKVGNYIDKVYRIYQYGNSDNRMDVNIIFINDKPIFAVLLECECEIINDILYLNEDNKEQVKINLKNYK